MRKSSCIAVLGIASILGTVVAVPASAAPSDAGKSALPPRAGRELVTRLIVSYEKGASPVDDAGLATGSDEVQGLDITPGEALGFKFRSVELPSPVSEDQAASIAQEFQSSPDVKSAVPDTPMSATGIVKTQSSSPWGLDRIDQRRGLDSRYKYSASGRGVTAYVVDTGVNPAHQDLRGRVLTGFSAYYDSSDCDGHGTHVAATIAGTKFGVAKDARIVPVKVLGCDGSGYTSDIIAGLNWVVSHHSSGAPAVLNMSLGGSVNASLDYAVNAVIRDGVTVAVASGNEAVNACYVSPARVVAAITVNASDSDDDDAWFSNYGACTDIYAPGVAIQSADAFDVNGSLELSGTSMAAPHVAGAAALVLERDPSMAPDQVWTAMSARATYNDFYPANPHDSKLLLNIDPRTTPEPPSSVRVTPADGQLHVSWQPPLNDGGSAITTYRALVADQECVVSASQRNCTFDRLTNGLLYDVRVSSTNSMGESEPAIATGSPSIEAAPAPEPTPSAPSPEATQPKVQPHPSIPQAKKFIKVRGTVVWLKLSGRSLVARYKGKRIHVNSDANYVRIGHKRYAIRSA